MVAESTLICIHGYGVRGFFWQEFALQAKQFFPEIICPNLRMETIESTIQEIIEIGKNQAGKPYILVGHSLGGVLSALAAQNLVGTGLLAWVGLACPFGFRGNATPAWLRFLLFHKLIPKFLIRRRFFGKSVPAQAQKELFSRVVKENEIFQRLINTSPWFHNNRIKPLPSIAMVAIASQADRIVSSEQSAAMAQAMAARFINFPKILGIGHDDYGVHAQAAVQVLLAIKDL